MYSKYYEKKKKLQKNECSNLFNTSYFVEISIGTKKSKEWYRVETIMLSQKKNASDWVWSKKAFGKVLP